MIDPNNITDYNRSPTQLEEFLLFCVLVAGHNAHTTAKTLEVLLSGRAPFQYLAQMAHACDQIGPNAFGLWLRDARVGCYNRVAKTIRVLTTLNLDLARCSVVDLEAVYGIGPKTARFFVVHSRPNQRYAILDTHILSFMRERGIATPASTPSGKKYIQLEREFLKIADNSNLSVAEFDLQIWKARAVSNG